MADILRQLGRSFQALHRDEQGADMIEYILIVAAIVLPLLGEIIYFKNDIGTWVSEQYDEIKAGQGTSPTQP
jgi:Flp pilus assembly pilin Flp